MNGLGWMMISAFLSGLTVGMFVNAGMSFWQLRKVKRQQQEAQWRHDGLI